MDETANVTPSNVGAYHHQTLAILTADLIRAQHEFQRGNLSQRDKVDSVVGSTRYRWHRNRQASQHIRIGTQRIGKTNNDVETAVTLKEGSSFPSADRSCDSILHIADVESKRAALSRSTLTLSSGRPVVCSTLLRTRTVRPEVSPRCHQPFC